LPLQRLKPLQTLIEIRDGNPLPLSAELQAFYGDLYFPVPGPRPHIFSNFVSTLDGVISLNEPGFLSPSEISGGSLHDRAVMGLLRAVCDVVIAGATAVRSSPGHIWTADFIYPPFAADYREIRQALGKPPHPVNVIVTAGGRIDLTLPLFQREDIPVLIITTPEAAGRLSAAGLPPAVQVRAIDAVGWFPAASIMQAVANEISAERILLEGGPHMTAEFFAAGLVDELFLTLAPQLAGRDSQVYRPGLVEGRRLAPHSPRWGRLVSLKAAGDYLFLRYRYDHKRDQRA
jgi:riboflavin biosynthesis pyrimidine reductase